MKMPNKVTPYKESSIAKFPVVLSLLEKKDMTPSELFSKVKRIKYRISMNLLKLSIVCTPCIK